MGARPRCSTPSRHRCPAVTLLEIVLAMGILVVVSSMMYWFYSSTLETSRRGTEAAQSLRLVRAVLDRIATEIRQVSAMPAEGRVGLRGEAEGIRLSSHRVPTREQSKDRPTTAPPPPAEYDLTMVEYKIARHPDIKHEDGYPLALGLARTEKLIPRAETSATENQARAKKERQPRGTGEAQTGLQDFGDPSGETDPELQEGLLGDLSREEREKQGEAGLGPEIDWEELYAPEIRLLRFCYFDGKSWWDSWDIAGDSPLPQLVQVTIGFEGHPPFGDDLGLDRMNEEYCKCLNREPVDCVPLGSDQFSMVIRVPQADPLFRSRVSRETQGLMEELGQQPEEESSP